MGGGDQTTCVRLAFIDGCQRTIIGTMKPPEHPKPHHQARSGDEEHREAPVGLSAIALDEEEASCFLKALEWPDDRTVAKLADLHRA
jgi:hypothetical protein